MTEAETKAVEQSVMEFLLAFTSKALPEQNHPDYIYDYGKLQNVGAWFPRTAFDKATSQSPNLAYGRFDGWSIKIKFAKGSSYVDGPGHRSTINLSHKAFGKIYCVAARGHFKGRTAKGHKPKFDPDLFRAFEHSELLVSTS